MHLGKTSLIALALIAFLWFFGFTIIKAVVGIAVLLFLLHAVGVPFTVTKNGVTTTYKWFKKIEQTVTGNR